MANLNKYTNILPVVSSTGGFYNPEEGINKKGQFYLDLNDGIPKGIEIRYKGNITIYKNPKFLNKVSISNNNQGGRIFLSSAVPYKYPSQELFTFLGDIKELKYVRIYNWASQSIYSNVKNYDQVNIALNHSDTNFEDDSIIIRDIKKVRATHRNIKKKLNNIDNYLKTKKEEKQLNLPDSYIGMSNVKGQYCLNCYFLKRVNYCEKWDAKISRGGWCASWKKEEGVK